MNGLYIDMGGTGNGTIYPALFQCKKCGVQMNSPEVFQLETLSHLNGYQKWFSIIALTISLISIIIAAFK